MEQPLEFVRFVNEQRKIRRPVAVHCEAGLGRTGTMLAVYLIAQGQSAETAIRQIREVEKVAVETPRQIQFLEEFAHLSPGKIQRKRYVNPRIAESDWSHEAMKFGAFNRLGNISSAATSKTMARVR